MSRGWKNFEIHNIKVQTVLKTACINIDNRGNSCKSSERKRILEKMSIFLENTYVKTYLSVVLCACVPTCVLLIVQHLPNTMV